MNVYRLPKNKKIGVTHTFVYIYNSQYLYPCIHSILPQYLHDCYYKGIKVFKSTNFPACLW